MDKSFFGKQLPENEYRQLPNVSFSDLKLSSFELGGSPQKYRFVKAQNLIGSDEYAEEQEEEVQSKAIRFGNALHLYMSSPEKIRVMAASGPDESTQIGIFINVAAREERKLRIASFKERNPDKDVSGYKEEFQSELDAGYYLADNIIWAESSTIKIAFAATQSKKYKVDYFLKALDEHKFFFSALVTHNPETEILVSSEMKESLHRSVNNLNSNIVYKKFSPYQDGIVCIDKDSDQVSKKKAIRFVIRFSELQVVTAKLKGVIDSVIFQFDLFEDNTATLEIGILDYKTNYTEIFNYVKSEKCKIDALQIAFYRELLGKFFYEAGGRDAVNAMLKFLIDDYLLQNQDETQEIKDILSKNYILSNINDANPEIIRFVTVGYIFHIQSSGKYNPVNHILVNPTSVPYLFFETLLLQHSYMKNGAELHLTMNFDSMDNNFLASPNIQNSLLALVKIKDSDDEQELF